MLIVFGSNGIVFFFKQFGIELVFINVELMQSVIVCFLLFLVLFVVVFVFVYEELLFCCVLFGCLWQVGCFWLGFIFSSLVFVLVYEVFGVSKNLLLGMVQLWLVYGGMGVVFCWLYCCIGILWVVIVVYVLNNVVVFVVMVFLGLM